MGDAHVWGRLDVAGTAGGDQPLPARGGVKGREGHLDCVGRLKEGERRVRGNGGRGEERVGREVVSLGWCVESGRREREGREGERREVLTG